jgi:hypothetical protein
VGKSIVQKLAPEIACLGGKFDIQRYFKLLSKSSTSEPISQIFYGDFGIFYGHLVYFMVILVYFMYGDFGIFYGDFGIFYGHLVYFMVILVYFMVILVYISRIGTLYQEKSGNPGCGLEHFYISEKIFFHSTNEVSCA